MPFDSSAPPPRGTGRDFQMSGQSRKFRFRQSRKFRFQNREPSKTCHSLIPGRVSSHRDRVPSRPRRGCAPKGSLYGWPRCKTMFVKGMAEKMNKITRSVTLLKAEVSTLPRHPGGIDRGGSGSRSTTWPHDRIPEMSPSPLALELAHSEEAEAGGYRQEPQSQPCKPILVDNALCGVRRTVSFKPSNTGFRVQPSSAPIGYSIWRGATAKGRIEKNATEHETGRTGNRCRDDSAVHARQPDRR